MPTAQRARKYTEAEATLIKLQEKLVRRQSWKLSRKMALLRRIDRAKKAVEREKLAKGVSDEKSSETPKGIETSPVQTRIETDEE